VKGHAGTRIGIDNIRFGAVLKTTTGPLGEYRLPGLAPGSYSILVSPGNGGYTPIPQTARTLATNVASTQPTTNVNFGLFSPPSPWQNRTINSDVNGDGSVFALDVLLVINAINNHGIIGLAGSNVPTTFLVDVNGDTMLTPLDVLTVINFINSSSRALSGEGEPAPLVYQPPTPADGEEPPVGLEGLYLGDEALSESLQANGSSILGSLTARLEYESGLLGLVGSSSQAVPEIKFDRQRLLTFDRPPATDSAIDSALSSLYLN
jgi:hypothetical protein